MAIAVDPTTQTAASELRSLLAQSENRLIKLDGRDAAAELYSGLDRLAEMWHELQESGVDLRGERTRWETLLAELRKRGAKVVAAWGGGSALATARAATAPDQSLWWWWLDGWVAEQRRKRAIRYGGLVAIGVAAIVFGVFLLGRLFPVDERVTATYNLRIQAETAANEGDYSTAYAAARQAVELTPEDPSLQVLAGVLAEQLGDRAAAEVAWDAGRKLLPEGEDEFLSQRALAYGLARQFEKSAQDALAAIDRNPNSARAYLYLGSAYEGLGMPGEALDAYGKAAELAGDADPELTVLARTRIASLLQNPPLPTAASP